MSRRTGALLLVLALAFALRVYRLPAQSLSYDEAVSVMLARMVPPRTLSWTAADVQPPLYYLLLELWRVPSGDSEYALRFLSVAWSLLAVALFFRLARRLAGPAAGTFAALAAAVHPWLVWHAQDARMYSQLLALGLLATILFLRWLTSIRTARATGRLEAGLALAYAAAMYTHYLAAAIFVYHLLIALVVAMAARRARLVGRYLARCLLPAALLYLPWLPAVVSTYRGDSSFWRGSIKLAEVARDSLIALLAGAPGETVTEQAGWPLALGLAATLLVLALATTRRQNMARFLFALGLVVVPALAVLGYVLLVPKFAERYLFTAALGLPVLWGIALGAAQQRRWPYRALAALALTLLLLGSWRGLAGMYWDTALTRADFRSAVGYILDQRQPDEAVLLSSGHLYPVWQYYAPDVPYVPLPPSRVLSVEERLGLDVGGELELDLADKRGAWLLLWQSEATDPMGALPFLLGLAGERQERGFWQVRVQHYRFRQARFELPPPVDRAAKCDFGGQVTLVGQRAVAPGEYALFWRASRVTERELRAQAIVSDEVGHRVAEYHFGPGGERYPTTLWRPGELVFGIVSLRLPPALPSGQYDLEVSLYDARSGEPLELLDAAGNPQGQLCRLGPISLEGQTAGVDLAAALAQYGLQAIEATWQGIELVGAGTCPREALPPGARVALPLLWQSAAPLPELTLEMRLGSGSDAPTQASPLSPTRSTALWPTGDTVLTWLDVLVPAATPGGEIPLYLRPIGLYGGGPPREVCRLNVEEVQRSYEQPAPRWASQATFGGFAALLGYDLAQDLVAPGGEVGVTLYWQARTTPAGNYSFFLHLLGPDGKVWAQRSGEPLEGGRPTAGWLPGEIIEERVDLRLPADALPGECQLEVGWYDQSVAGIPRLEAKEDGARLPDDAARLGTLRVSP